MPPNPPLEIPTEIPWQLVSTTQTLGAETLGPDTTAISMFTYVPQLQSLNQDYPNDQLIYFKFIVSVAPMIPLQLFGPPPPPGDPLSLFSDTLPVWRLLFDLRIASEPFSAVGAIKPCFLAATPIRRAMVETGILGQQASEGESKALAIGKSGAQMHEGYSSTVDTNTNSSGASLPVGSFSGTDTSTVAAGSRDVVQNIDTTQRDASTERQELVSHMTNVTNIMTLLNAFDIGSPYLRFSLWSRPLRPLAVDPNDPNLWYAELLRRRSSGIEGVQEFYSIAAVPRSLGGFCIKANLRRFCFIPAPLPSGKAVEMPGGTFPTFAQEARLVDYLHRRYPKGTPTDDLDVDVKFFGDPQTNRPAVSDFFSVGLNNTVTEAVMRVGAVDANSNGIIQPWGWYKSHVEIWLDMKRDEYEQELLKSPLAEGVPVFKTLTLDTCFGPPVTPLVVVKQTVGQAKKPSQHASATAARPAIESLPGGRRFDLYRQAVFNWNAAESQLGSLVTHTANLPETELRLDHPKLVDATIRKLAALERNDPVNQNLNDAANWFGLTPPRVLDLQRRGIADVRGLAEAIDLASVIDRINQERAAIAGVSTQLPPVRPAGATIAIVPTRPTPTPIPPILSVAEADQLRQAFAAALQARFDAIGP